MCTGPAQSSAEEEGSPPKDAAAAEQPHDEEEEAAARLAFQYEARRQVRMQLQRCAEKPSTSRNILHVDGKKERTRNAQILCDP
jgi:hypothetical protein